MAYNLGQFDPEERTDLYADRRDEDDVPPPRRLLRIGVTLVVMGLFAGGLWFAYTAGMHAGGSGDGSDIPLIRADTRPMKVKPQNPGGMQIPDRDMLIYGQQRPQVEHLLPPPEQPMARPAPPPPTPRSQVQTVSLTPSSAPPAAPSGASAEAVASAPVASAPVATPPQLSPAAMAAANELATASSAVAQKTAVQPTPGKAGGLRLQLGAVRSETEARGEWQRLKHQNADLLGKLSGVAIRADLGDKGIYYRIQAGPVADASIADRICGELRQRRLACVIVR